MDPSVVSDMVVTQRLEKVATQLAKVADCSAEDKKLEEELLKSDTPMVSPPPETAKAADAPMTAPGASSTTESDQLDERVNQIFGKKRAIEDDGPVASPKVANITVTKGSNDDGTDMAIGGGGVSNDNTDSLQKKGQVNEVNMDVGDNNDDNNGDNNDGDDEEEEGEWEEPEEEPAAYPEGAFPMQVPGYPMQPTFNYRYRTPNSTPRSRRIDFKNSIVVRNVTRDPHTGRVSQEDYEIREDSEMALSLG